MIIMKMLGSSRPLLAIVGALWLGSAAAQAALAPISFGPSPAGGAAAGGKPAGGPPAAAPSSEPDSDLIVPEMNANGSKSSEELLKVFVPPAPPNLPDPPADPRNLEGTWIHNTLLVTEIAHDLYGNRPPFNDRARKVLRRRIATLEAGKPYSNASATCHPPGPPWQEDLNFPFKIFQSRHRIEILFQEFHGLETISMDPNPTPAPPNFGGHSVGHWDGDTLVVVTSGFNQAPWMDVIGTPASSKAVITQRFRKRHQGIWFLEIETTLDDPTFYTHPWSWVRTFSWRPDLEILKEYDCETQLGDKTNNANGGLVPEPPDDQP